MDIRKKRYMKVDYNVYDGEDSQPTKSFIYEISPDETDQTYPDFITLIENFDRLEGTDWAGKISIIKEEIIESEFVDDPQITRKFAVEVPIKGIYTQEVEVEMSKYTADIHQMKDIEKTAIQRTYNDIETDRIKTENIYSVGLIDTMPSTAIISREISMEEEDEEE